MTDSVLYLIWKPGETGISEITVYKGFKDSLADNFRRLLTKEALDRNSQFMKSFAGLPDRFQVALEIKSNGFKITDYYYDAIGFKVSHLDAGDHEDVYFALIKKSSGH